MTAMCCWLKAPNRTSDASDEVIIVFNSTFFPSFSLLLSLGKNLKSPSESHNGAFNVEQLSLEGKK